MKKQGILNSHISEVLSRMGHTDTIVIGDCGLPIPDGTIRIDLAIKLGNPSFMEVLEAVFQDMAVEKLTLANEIKEFNPNVMSEVLALTNGIPAQYMSHEQFKEETKKAKAIIRTGEATPFANIILHAGVIF
ncbi:D-ribose pyranase [Bacillus sp. 1NLA3E]|uniref:D-ribose pyranase n=1 Tax=Bacillus sp. 1NLA3E TaxID=666686 RepID=UPI000247EA6B|nr:D-ribose pyranase [Bacillus sp. 1NLA3E]AGK52415.1 transport protein RbsD/FucU [Bacillus sp. 1NLA3E]